MRKSNQRGPKVIPRLLFQLLSAMITIQAVDIAVYMNMEVIKALPLLGLWVFPQESGRRSRMIRNGERPLQISCGR